MNEAAEREGNRRPIAAIGGSTLLLFFGLPVLLLVSLPLLALFLRVDPHAIWKDCLADRLTRQAFWLSIETSFLSTLLVMLLGTPLACLLARPQVRWRGILESILQLSTVIPPAVAGVGLLMAFGRNGLLGAWLAKLGITLPFTPVAVVMAQSFVASPYFIRSAAFALAAIDPELEKVARLEGAGNWQVFRHVLFPLAWRGFVAGATMSWARAVGEFGATIIFAGNYPGRTQTLPIAVYLGLETGLDRALVLAVILLVFSFGALFLIHLLTREPG